MNAVISGERLRQRSDYTYKFNTKTGRHGWLRLTPAYSLKVVEELLDSRAQSLRIFDPFCGTGTTALSAVYHGHEGVTTDINPFLLWLANAKSALYTPEDLHRARTAARAIAKLVKKPSLQPVVAPPIHNIERWWSANALDFLCLLRSAIAVETAANSPERTLLDVAFCRTLIDVSNAAFNHQSMSFKDDAQVSIELEVDRIGKFVADVEFVLAGAGENPTAAATVVFGDARNSSRYVSGPFDVVITSPPYVNRMSYIRELRPYMYWLGYLTNGRDAGELDWTAIGGTWGIATSRLAEWQSAGDGFQSARLGQVLNKIAHSDNKNGLLLSNYVAKYFDDMWAHFNGLTPVLAPDAEVHYIVGNSTFYGVLVSAEQFYAEMLQLLGFQSVECRPIRKRNSKKELVEFDVVGRWRARNS